MHDGLGAWDVYPLEQHTDARNRIEFATSECSKDPFALSLGCGSVQVSDLHSSVREPIADVDRMLNVDGEDECATSLTFDHTSGAAQV